MESKNTELKIVNKEDVKKLFEELLPWDKVELLKELANKYDSALIVEEEPYEPTCWEFVRDHDSDEILDEMNMDEILLYLRDYSSLHEVLEFFMTEGKGFRYNEKTGSREMMGFTAEEINKEVTDISMNLQYD